MRRVVIISDLHIGGAEHPMLGHPEVLTGFLEQLASDPRRDEIELVIAGDFIDFLAESPFEPWTVTEAEACRKLEAAFQRNEALFDGFARCARHLGRSTVLLGNHDVELAYPRVREDLYRRLHTAPHRCHFIQSNEAYRIGELLIEHGNRYDSWNAIDHDGLRQLASSASRGEVPPRPLDVCPGSRLVHGAMNPLKERYHFIDLLKPEGKILALLLLELEPSLVRKSLPQLFRLASAWVAERYRKATWHAQGDGVSPTNERLVAAKDADRLPSDIRRAFRQELDEIEAQQQQRTVGAGDTRGKLWTIFRGRGEDGLKEMYARGESIPMPRLRKLQAALRGVLDGDRTFEEGLPDGNCHAAAKKMIEAGVAKVVVMGHTHLARDIAVPADGRYLNTGTWADLIRIDASLLADTDEAREEFAEWLRKLAEDRLDGIRQHMPRFACVEVDDAGRVGSASLHEYHAGERLPWA